MTRDFPTVLLTGFDPFDSKPINPSWEAVRLLADVSGSDVPDAELPGLDLPGIDLRVAELPCEFGVCADVLAELVDTHQPNLVICVGEAAGRTKLSVERIAINVADARIPDNAGRQPIDEPLVPGAPAAYFSTLPIKAAVAAAGGAGAPAAVSQTAGTYVCNDVFFRLMHLIATRHPQMRGGFVHVPSAEDMSAGDAASGLAAVVKACVMSDADIVAVGGAEH